MQSDAPLPFSCLANAALPSALKKQGLLHNCSYENPYAMRTCMAVLPVQRHAKACLYSHVPEPRAHLQLLDGGAAAQHRRRIS